MATTSIYSYCEKILKMQREPIPLGKAYLEKKPLKKSDTVPDQWGCSSFSIPRISNKQKRNNMKTHIKNSPPSNSIPLLFLEQCNWSNFPRGAMSMSGDIFNYHNWLGGRSRGKECYWHLVGKARDAGKHPTRHRITSQQRSIQNINNAEVQKSFSTGIILGHLVWSMWDEELPILWKSLFSCSVTDKHLDTEFPNWQEPEGLSSQAQLEKLRSREVKSFTQVHRRKQQLDWN